MQALLKALLWPLSRGAGHRGGVNPGRKGTLQCADSRDVLLTPSHFREIQHIRKNDQGGSQRKSVKPSRNQSGLGSRDDPTLKDNRKSLSLAGFSLLSGSPFLLCLEVARMPRTGILDTITQINSTPSHRARNQI